MVWAVLLPLRGMAAESPADACLRDLDALPAYLLENDTGAADHIARKGQAVFDAALQTARRAAAQAPSDDACLDALRAYLLTYRHGHLEITPAHATAHTDGAPARAPAMPAFRILSPRTGLLVLPSFADAPGRRLKELLKAHAAQIAARDNLIIDVRGNTGGADWVFQPLLPLMDANLRRQAGAQFLSTPANIQASATMCEVFAPDSDECRQAAARLVALLSNAAPGTYVGIPGQPAVAVTEPKSVKPMPRRVAVLVDGRCGSSCEEFVLAARQSYKVKVFGQTTAGALDYSNLRPYRLPSGRRHLLYATSRSQRLPEFSVDAAGIPPDQVLPAPQNAPAREAELMEVMRVVESAH